MKNKLWVAPLALTFALGACDSMLQEEPVSFITTGTYYKTADDLEKGMLSGWGSLRSVFPGSFNCWTGFMGTMSDQERTDPNEVNSPRTVGGLDLRARGAGDVLVRVPLLLQDERHRGVRQLRPG